MKRFLKPLRILVILFVAASAIGALTVGALYLYLAPDLPEIETLKDVKLTLPLRVYARDGALLAEYGKQRRTPIRYSSVPDMMIKAFLAAEDDRFFEHPGVDYQGLIRAALHLIRTGEKGQGGSTITMQVARNFFLSREKTYLRKINEIFLSLKIERELTKEDIFELYVNVIYLGNRAYGVQAAAQVYYGRNVHELDLPEIAMIAGLPKAPSRYNPIANSERAVIRRDYVLGRMRDLDYISEEQYQQAKQTSVTARLHGLGVQVDAPYAAEMVRAEMYERYGQDIYSKGYRVYTTIDSQAQGAANRALRQALLEYDRRHGYRGPEQQFPELMDQGAERWDQVLEDIPKVGGLLPGIVITVAEQSAVVYLGDGREVELAWEGIQWARQYIEANKRGPALKQASEVLTPGDLIRLQLSNEKDKQTWQLAQIPNVAGALVALSPHDGALVSLTGGFDYFHSKFNRARQARRQPGSSFKPFIYTAALAKGFTPASIINDAPVVFDDPALEDSWRPENYSGRFYGPTRLREALTHSRNLVSIRLLREIGIGYTSRYLRRFGISNDMIQKDLTLALGSGSITPMELATAYAVIANGGFRVEPYLVDRIEDDDGMVLFEADPAIACLECEQAQKQQQEQKEQTEQQSATQPTETATKQPDVADVDAAESAATASMDSAAQAEPEPPAEPKLAERVIEAEHAYLINSMMRDVVRYGTGRRALRLGRQDLAGKTGTTNDQRDAWFSGFNGDLVATAWVGFDRVQPLGHRETGGRAALPMWIDFMREALKGRPTAILKQPEGMVTVRIDPETGLLADAQTRNAIFETFEADHLPDKSVEGSVDLPGNGRSTKPGGGGEQPDIIF